MSATPVRRDKAALSSGCESHPANAPAGSNRSSYGGDEVAEAFCRFSEPRWQLTNANTSPNELNTTLMPRSIPHGDACFAYFNKIWGIPLRSESYRHAALPRIDGMVPSATFRAAAKSIFIRSPGQRSKAVGIVRYSAFGVWALITPCRARL